MKVGVFLPNWVGDAVMAGPTLRALRRHYGPKATLLGIMRPFVADVLAGTAWLDDHIFYDPRSPEKELGHWTLVRRLRQRGLDVAVLLTNSLRSALVAFFGGARERIGYARYGREPLLTHGLTPPQGNGRIVPFPTVDYYLEIAYALGCPPESPRLELATRPDDERAANVIWSKLGLREAEHVVTFNCSGAYGAAKLWPTEHFAGLARRVAVELARDVLVVCGPNERELAEDIVRRAAHPRVVSLADEPLSIGLSKACIRRSHLLVTTDSGPRHIAVAFEVPVVGLYGPTPPIWGHNPTAREVAVHLDLDCLGCHERTCPLGHHRCMRDLSVEQVFRAVHSQLNQPRRQAA
jgi:heptosyltransferase-2